MLYVARGSRIRGFVLADDSGNTLGTIAYNGWFYRKAQLRLYNSDTYNVVSNNFWVTSFDILHAEIKTGEIRMRLNGKNELAFNNSKYLYKRKGPWWQNFVLCDEAAYEIANVRQRYDWRKFGFIYEINVDPGFQSPDILPLMLLIVYTTNQQYARAGGS